MSTTSQQSIELDARLLAVEDLFRRRDLQQALEVLDRLEQEGYHPEGLNRGLYLLLQARRAVVNNDYQGALRLCQQAFDVIGGTSLNSRIGRLQLTLYKAYAGLGDLRQAEMSARDALASFRRIRDDIGIMDAYNALARLYFLRSEYAMAAEYVNEAIQHAESDPVQKGQLLGNVGRIYLMTGEIDRAEANLRQSLEISQKHNTPFWLVSDRLSLAYLHIRQRRFPQAETELDAARVLIEKHDFKREEIIYLEYLGELAYEKQDFVVARAHLEKALERGSLLAPESTLISQTLRRLAAVELELGHHEEAMRLGQKGLDLAQRIGEKAEVALSHRVIATVFLARNDQADARRHALQGIEILREIGDTFEFGRSIIALGAIPPCGRAIDDRKTFSLFQDAERVFSLLNDEHYLAECHYEMGRHCQAIGRNGEALEYLKDAARRFRAIDDYVGASKVSEFLGSLSLSAINRALSDDNEFKVFGSIISGSDYKNLKNGPLDRLFDILVQRTAADRAFIITITQGERPEITAAHGLDEADRDGVVRKFGDLIDSRVIGGTPMLLLDCSDDDNFGDLMASSQRGAIGSLMILPLVLGTDIVGYIYLDRGTGENGREINPFAQNEVDFAVGFADLAAFKASEYQKEKLLEDNLRLRAQLLEKCVFPNIITQSRTFMEMLARVRQVANSNMAISITGETGTGKDLLAKAIHYNSGRRDKNLISVNCAALPESLLESELFGYKKGAFTGADRDKPGLFEEADGGSFFLDEIADMPMAIQAKLLRVLENQEITRLGDTKPRQVDVRVISATNKELKAEMEERRFRSDLYYRLCALNFAIPALRERKEDVPLLVAHFLADSNCQISPDAMRSLVDYDWPGNVRELENEVKKLVLLANNQGIITSSLLSARIIGEESQAVSDDPQEAALIPGNGFSLYDYLSEYEKRFIIKALKEQHGVKKRAAEALRIPESTLRLKLKQYGIDSRRLDRLS